MRAIATLFALSSFLIPPSRRPGLADCANDKSGIAKILSTEIGDLTSLTNTGEFLDITAFMSPEQILGEKIDHRTDVHALGILMYVMLTGALPYGGTVASQVVVAIVQNTAAPMTMIAPNARITEAMELVVARALHKEPRLREPGTPRRWRTAPSRPQRPRAAQRVERGAPPLAGQGAPRAA